MVEGIGQNEATCIYQCLTRRDCLLKTIAYYDCLFLLDHVSNFFHISTSFRSQLTTCSSRSKRPPTSSAIGISTSLAKSVSTGSERRRKTSAKTPKRRRTERLPNPMKTPGREDPSCERSKYHSRCNIKPIYLSSSLNTHSMSVVRDNYPRHLD